MKPGEWSKTTGIGLPESRAGRHTVHPVVLSTSFVLELDRISSGHASVSDADDGTFVTP